MEVKSGWNFFEFPDEFQELFNEYAKQGIGILEKEWHKIEKRESLIKDAVHTSKNKDEYKNLLPPGLLEQLNSDVKGIYENLTEDDIKKALQNF